MASEHHATRWAGSGKRSVRVGQQPESETGTTVSVEPASEDDAAEATDAARELADEHGIDLATVSGTGAEGRITKDDVAALVPDATD